MLLGSLSLPKQPVTARGTHFVVVLPSAHKVAASAHAPAAGLCGLHNLTCFETHWPRMRPGAEQRGLFCTQREEIWGGAHSSVCENTAAHSSVCENTARWERLLQILSGSAGLVQGSDWLSGSECSVEITLGSVWGCIGLTERAVCLIWLGTHEIIHESVCCSVFTAVWRWRSSYLGVIPLFINLGIAGKVTI